jgi:hypothetical protein
MYVYRYTGLHDNQRVACYGYRGHIEVLTMIPAFRTCAGRFLDLTLYCTNTTLNYKKFCAVFFFQWKFVGRRARCHRDDLVEISMISVHLGFSRRASCRIGSCISGALDASRVAKPTTRMQLAQFPGADVNRCATRRWRTVN